MAGANAVPGCKCKIIVSVRQEGLKEETACFGCLNEILFQVLSSVHELRKKIKLDAEESFFACPTKVGLHISIGKHKIGERIDFKIEKLMSYQNQTMEKPNQFDKTKFVAHWIAVRVTLLKEIEQVSSAHITFAAIGFEKKT
jgi:hypothetical protein